jgi:EpsD family peptidyl-prolyl cis-trans isomerase
MGNVGVKHSTWGMSVGDPMTGRGYFPKERGLGMRLLILAFIVMATVSFAEAQDALGETGIAATVNGSVITTAEIDILQRSAGPQGQSPEAVRKVILSQLIELEILAQQAREAGLDIDPAAQANAVISERAALAGLQSQAIVANLSNLLSDDDPRIGSLITQNPQLFSGRKLFIIEETNPVTGSEAFWDELEDGDSVAELKALAATYNLEIAFSTKALFSNEAPPALLPVFETADVGSLLVLKANKAALTGRFLVVASVFDAPLVDAEARRAASSIIRDALIRQAVEEKAKSSLAASDIIYHGEFAEEPGIQASSLPQGITPEQKAKSRLIAAVFSVGLFFSLAIGFLAAVSAHRYWTGRLYLPGIFLITKVSEPKLEINVAVDPFNNAKTGSTLGKVVIFLLAPLFLLVLAAHGYFAYLYLGYGVVAVLAIGLPCSIWLSFKYSQSRLRVWSREHRFAPVAVFAGMSSAVSLGSTYLAYSM